MRCSPALSRPLAFLLSLLPTLLGCPIERLDPDRVAMGVARLSIRNAGGVLAAINADTTCGFASRSVLDAVELTGTPMHEGSATYRVSDCVLLFPSPTVLSKDCNGVETVVTGRVTVSAVKILQGTVTGLKDNPVVPTSPDAVSFAVSAELDHFEVRTSASKAGLTHLAGKLSFESKPPLAVSASQGVCALPTGEVMFANVRYENAKVKVDSGDRVFEVDVPSSGLDAQVGAYNGKENALEGTLTVWDVPVKVPVANDVHGLDPEYVPESFVSGYACNPDLAVPLSRTCPRLEDAIATGGAQLSVNAVGQLVSLIEHDTRCGFSAPAVLAAGALKGSVGKAGDVTFSLGAGCTLTNLQPKPTDTPNCFGVTPLAKGTVVVTGTKKVHGILTGSKETPVVPTARDAVEFQLRLQFRELTVSDTATPVAVTLKNGAIAATVRPRLALDTALGACSLKTPVVEFARLQHENVDLVLQSASGSFPVRFSTSDLQAQSGSKNGRTNYLAGTVVIDGQAVTLPRPGMPPTLDPAYQPERFDASYACEPHLKVPASDAECSFVKPLGQNAARLIIQALGSTTKLISNDDSCGFENTFVKLNPESVTGSSGELGAMTWKLSGCHVGGGVKSLGADCKGTGNFTSGDALIDVRRTVKGLRGTEFLIFSSIQPVTPDGVRLQFLGVQYNQFATYTVEAGKTEPNYKLTLLEGLLTGSVTPILGERRSNPGAFDVPTPVASMTDVTLLRAKALLEANGMRFSLDIPEAHLSALNGSFRGHSNELTGSIRVGADEVLLNQPLNPDFEQRAFDATYSCTEDLRALVSPK